MSEVKKKVFLSESGKEAQDAKKPEVVSVTYQLRPVFSDTTFLKQEMTKKAQGG